MPDNPSEDFKPSEYFERSVPDGEGNSALHHAVMKRDIDAIRYVLSLGEDINVPNAHGVCCGSAKRPCRGSPFPKWNLLDARSACTLAWSVALPLVFEVLQVTSLADFLSPSYPPPSLLPALPGGR